MKNSGFTSDTEVYTLVSAFESGRLALAEFSHAAHLAVALTYLNGSPLPKATDQMRTSLQHFLDHHRQSSGYHETLTVFWMRLLDHLASERHAYLPLWKRINVVVRSHGGSWPVAAHYSRARAGSAEARQHWVDPDLLPMPF